MNFTTNYLDILAKLQQFNPVEYSKSRNFLDGRVSFLSPYLTHGVLSLKEVLESVLSKYSFNTVEKFIFELAWKEYFQRVWENKEDQIFSDLKTTQTNVESYNFPKNIFDANLEIKVLNQAVKDLYQFGYIHNHARMWLASIVCNLGRYHWGLPAKWFYYHLLDGDLASNSLSWQWVAGSFSSKKYYANQDNLNKYSKTTQHNTFIDVDYFKISKISRSSTLSPELSELEINLKTDLSPKNLQSLTSLKILSKQSLASNLFVFHPWMLSPNIKVDPKAQSILFLEKSHFEKFPISNKRLQFILNLSSNLNLVGVYVGEIADLQDKCIITQFYPAIKHWSRYPKIQILSRQYMFENVDKYFGSFFGYWKKCLKQNSTKFNKTS